MGRCRPGSTSREFRIGVTGHRADRLGLEDADLAVLRARIREVFALIERTVQGTGAGRAGASTDAPVSLVVVSPLAEGADRLVAQEGVAAGFALHCPLPFDRDEYARDFATPVSCAEYRALLRRAASVVELPGSRRTPADEEAAYVAVGRTVLAQSDVLIAIWDGEKARGNGGTEQVVQEALDRAMPVIWIGVHPPHTMSVAARAADGAVVAEPLDRLAGLMRAGRGDGP